MKLRKFVVMGIMIAISSIMLSGCGKDTATDQSEAFQKAVDEAVEKALEEQNQKTEEATQEGASEETEDTADEEPIDYGYSEDGIDYTFLGEEGQEFVFSNAAGDWSTNVVVKADGSFYGSYYDPATDETGTDYPNGTVYSSYFSGVFEPAVMLNDYTYEAQISEIDYDKELDSEEITDGTRYVTCAAYGLSDSEKFQFYLPGAPLKELPDSFLSWVEILGLKDKKGSTLSFYGLYNVDMEQGMKAMEEASYETSDTPSIDERIDSARLTEKELGAEIDRPDATQLEMNETSAGIYKVWDDLLNWEWEEIETCLDEASFKTLQAEQKKWIAMRDAEIKKAGAEVEGGSMQPCMESGKGAELTEKRVEELAKWLR